MPIEAGFGRTYEKQRREVANEEGNNCSRIHAADPDVSVQYVKKEMLCGNALRDVRAGNPSRMRTRSVLLLSIRLYGLGPSATDLSYSDVLRITNQSEEMPSILIANCFSYITLKRILSRWVVKFMGIQTWGSGWVHNGIIMKCTHNVSVLLWECDRFNAVLWVWGRERFGGHAQTKQFTHKGTGLDLS